MRLNISKEEIENKLKKKEKMIFVLTWSSTFAAFTLSLLFGNGFIESVAIAFGVFFFFLIIPGVLERDIPPTTPFYIYDYFEKLNEKVFSAENIGSIVHVGRNSHFESSNFWKVNTDKGSYLLEIDNDQVASCTEHKKNAPV